MKYVIAQGNPFDWEQPVRLTGTFNSIQECDEYAQLYSISNYWSVPVDSPGSLWVATDTGEPKFKVGDRLRVVEDAPNSILTNWGVAGHTGQEGVVTEFDPGDSAYKLNDDYWYPEVVLELVQ